MKVHLKSILTILFWSMLLASGFSQSDILNQYVQTALENNLSIQSNILKKQQQQSKIDQAKKLWNPTVDFNASYLFAEGGREIIFPIGDLFNPVYGTLNQLTNSNQFPTNLENESIQLTPNNFLDAQLSIAKPLINSSIKYNQRIQKELLKINDLDIELSKKEIAYQVQSSYFNYLKTIEGLRIIGETEQLLKDVLAFNKKLVKYDKATSNIISDVEFQIANLKSQEALLIEQQTLAQAYFNLLLNQPLDTEIEIDENLLAGNFDAPEKIAALKSQALQSRLEFKKLTVATAVNQLNQTRIQKEKSPTVGISGGAGMQTESFSFDNGGVLFTLAVGMNWNIFDGGLRKKKIEEIQIHQKMLENDRQRLTQQVEMEVTQIYFALQSLRLKMQSEQAAVTAARRSYEVIKTRYENDKAMLIELLQAQNSLTTSELSQALTKYDYLTQLALLEKSIN